MIPPSGNTSFDIVFLGREEGLVENTLYIHTSAGSFRFQVRATGMPNPYRCQSYKTLIFVNDDAAKLGCLSTPSKTKIRTLAHRVKHNKVLPYWTYWAWLKVPAGTKHSSLFQQSVIDRDKRFMTFVTRLKPLVGVKMPINSSYIQHIEMHNPHSEPIQVGWGATTLGITIKNVTPSMN